MKETNNLTREVDFFIVVYEEGKTSDQRVVREICSYGYMDRILMLRSGLCGAGVDSGTGTKTLLCDLTLNFRYEPLHSALHILVSCEGALSLVPLLLMNQVDNRATSASDSGDLAIQSCTCCRSPRRMSTRLRSSFAQQFSGQ